MSGPRFNVVDRALDAAVQVSMIDRKTILADCRFRHVSRARQAAYLVAHENGASFCRIGKRMSREHSTVMQGCGAARKRESDCPEYARMVSAIRERAA